MKKIILIVSACLLMVSCQKNDDQPQPQENQPVGNSGTNVVITDSMYLGSWILNGSQYNNIGPDLSDPYTFNHYVDCNTPSISNFPQELEFRNDTMVFVGTTSYEWIYTEGNDTLWSGIGASALTYYVKCI